MHTSPSVCKSSGFIGSYVDKDTGDETPTEWGIIHSSKKGAHIVPALSDITYILYFIWGINYEKKRNYFKYANGFSWSNL